MTPPAAPSPFVQPWALARVAAHGWLDSGSDPQLFESTANLIRTGPSFTVGVGFRKAFVALYAAYRHTVPRPGPALRRGTTARDDAAGAGLRFYWTWDTRRRFELLGEYGVLGGAVRFGGPEPSKGTYVEQSLGAGVIVRFDRNWSGGVIAGLGSGSGYPPPPVANSAGPFVPARLGSSSYWLGLELQWGGG